MHMTYSVRRTINPYQIEIIILELWIISPCVIYYQTEEQKSYAYENYMPNVSIEKQRQQQRLPQTTFIDRLDIVKYILLYTSIIFCLFFVFLINKYGAPRRDRLVRACVLFE